MRFNGAIIYTADIEQSIEFYSTIIGLFLNSKNSHYAELNTENGINLGIKKASQEREIPGHQTIILEVEDVAVEHNRLSSAEKVTLESLKSESWGDTFCAYDPDGNKIEYVKQT